MCPKSKQIFFYPIKELESSSLAFSALQNHNFTDDVNCDFQKMNDAENWINKGRENSF
jgi:hypothetical protein